MAECIENSRARLSMSRRQAAIDVGVIGGPVAPMDEAYAREQVAYLTRHSARAVQCGRVRLCACVDDGGRSVAAVDGLVVLDDADVICAGAVSTSMSEAIDQLLARLRRRLMGDVERVWSPSPRSRAAAAAATA